MLFLAASLSAQNGFSQLSGPFFGQTPPGKTAQPFGLAIEGLHQNLHSALIFSPDGGEAWWKPGWNPKDPIYTSRIENGRWTTPKKAPFSAPDQGDDSPFVSPDGKKMYFLSQREEREKEILYVMERTSQGWSEPIPLPITVESYRIHWQISVDRDNNIYFGAGQAVDRKLVGDIYCARIEKGKYGKPEKLGPAINLAGEYNYSPFIAQDGSYLIFTRSQTPAILYISYHKNDGSWTPAKDLSAVIKSDVSQNPFVTSDGKYLFFTIGGRVHWVDAGFIEEMRLEERRPND